MTEFQMIKAVIFDMDGVLTDSEIVYLNHMRPGLLKEIKDRGYLLALALSTTVFILTVHWLITACMSSPKFSRFWISWPL